MFENGDVNLVATQVKLLNSFLVLAGSELILSPFYFYFCSWVGVGSLWNSEIPFSLHLISILSSNPGETEARSFKHSQI